MTLKKIKIISIIGIFLLSILFHFLYDLMPSLITSLLFPVNESIWEHMKLIFTSTLVFSVIEYLLLKKYNIKNNKYLNYLSIILIIITFIIFIYW